MSLLQTFNDWITLADAHALLGTNSPADDVEVQGMVDSIDALILSYLYRDLRHAEYSQVFFRPEGSFLMLNHWPVISITSIDSDGSSVAESEFDIDEHLGMMHYSLEGLTFTGGQPKKITVQYISGYLILPLELQVVFNTLLVARYAADGAATASETGEIKKVSMVGLGTVEFEASGSAVSYTGVDRTTGVPEELKPYVGILDKYRSDRAMGVI